MDGQASGWASALRVLSCLFSMTSPSRKIAETRIADAIPLAGGNRLRRGEMIIDYWRLEIANLKDKLWA